MSKTPPLEPGLYLGLDDEIYFNDPAISYSGGLKPLLISPSEYWYGSWANPARDAAKLETDAMAQGKLFHCLLLEPDQFDERYFVMPGQRWDDSKKLVSRVDYLNTMKAVNIVRQSTGWEGVPVGAFFDRRWGYPEVTAVWPDPVTGLMCRAKHDFFCWEWSVDYKTIADISSNGIGRAFSRYQYGLQHVHYLESRIVLRELIKSGHANFYGEFSEEFRHQFLDGSDDTFMFVVQKKDEPFTVVPIILGEDRVYYARHDRAKALAACKRCIDKFGWDKPWPVATESGVRVLTMNGFEGD